MRTLTKMECETASGSVVVVVKDNNGNEQSFQLAQLINNNPTLGDQQHHKINLINVGTAAGALAAGLMAGGPVGFGFALGSIIIATGVNGLVSLLQK